MNTRLLRSKMVLAGKTQKDIAHLLGKTEATVSAKFKGKCPLFIDEADAICGALGITNQAEKAEIFLNNSSLKGDGIQERSESRG